MEQGAATPERNGLRCHPDEMMIKVFRISYGYAMRQDDRSYIDDFHCALATAQEQHEDVCQYLAYSRPLSEVAIMLSTARSIQRVPRASQLNLNGEVGAFLRGFIRDHTHNVEDDELNSILRDIIYAYEDWVAENK